MPFNPTSAMNTLQYPPPCKLRKSLTFLLVVGIVLFLISSTFNKFAPFMTLPRYFTSLKATSGLLDSDKNHIQIIKFYSKLLLKTDMPSMWQKSQLTFTPISGKVSGAFCRSNGSLVNLYRSLPFLLEDVQSPEI